MGLLLSCIPMGPGMQKCIVPLTHYEGLLHYYELKNLLRSSSSSEGMATRTFFFFTDCVIWKLTAFNWPLHSWLAVLHLFPHHSLSTPHTVPEGREPRCWYGRFFMSVLVSFHRKKFGSVSAPEQKYFPWRFVMVFICVKKNEIKVTTKIVHKNINFSLKWIMNSLSRLNALNQGSEHDLRSSTLSSVVSDMRDCCSDKL